MLVTVKVLGGAEHTLDVAADTPVIRVKQVLATAINESTSNQRLIFKGKALADDKPLKFYNITNGSKLNLVIKPVATVTTGAPPTTTTTTTTAAATIATTSTSSSVTTSSTAQDSSKRGRFHLLLQEFLQQHYTPEDVTKLMEQVNKGIHDLVYNLNLDDIENTAVRNLEQQPNK